VLDITTAPMGSKAPTGGRAPAVALPVCPDGERGALVATGWPLPDPVTSEVSEFLVDVDHRGDAGTVHLLPRPSRDPAHLLLVGIGDGDAGGWREAGAAVARTAAERLAAVTVALPADATAG